MAIITICLATLIIARFKAHTWVKYIGIGTLGVSIFLALCSLISASSAILELEGGVEPSILWSCIHTACLDIAYGLVVYLISLIFRGHFKSRK